MAKGTVYLIHFERPYKHAAHYIGFTKRDSPRRRLASHRAGHGARLLLVLNIHGIHYNVVRIWRNETRTFERHLKNNRKPARICPYCNARLKKHTYRFHKQ